MDPKKTTCIDLSGVRSIEKVRVLIDINNQVLNDMKKDELVEMVKALKAELLNYCDSICDADSAAEFFGRKRSWIYECMSRPSTQLQRDVSEIAARETGGLLFRLSDLVLIRKNLFENRGSL